MGLVGIRSGLIQAHHYPLSVNASSPPCLLHGLALGSGWSGWGQQGLYNPLPLLSPTPIHPAGCLLEACLGLVL